jgi:hypothetical protein
MAMKWRQYLSGSPIVKSPEEGHFEDIGDIALKANSKTLSSHSDSIPTGPISPTSFPKSSELPLRTVTTDQHNGPLQPGWVVACRDRFGMLRGGWDDAERATVVVCHFDGLSWLVRLSGGEEVPLGAIRSVARTDNGGAVIAAWTVRECGYDGLK